jgi:hypothetical protein
MARQKRIGGWVARVMHEPIDECFRYGGQYYAAGRYAAFAGFNPVVGNLFHHAIEMFIKGALSKSLPLKILRDNFGHKLPKLWDEIKKTDPALSRFDNLIVSLDKYEEIRYPDKLLLEGASLHIDITKVGAEMNKSSGEHADKLPVYKVCVEEIDELVAALFRLGSRNPSVFLPHMKEDAKTYVNKDNAHLKV